MLVVELFVVRLEVAEITDARNVCLRSISCFTPALFYLSPNNALRTKYADRGELSSLFAKRMGIPDVRVTA